MPDTHDTTIIEVTARLTERFGEHAALHLMRQSNGIWCAWATVGTHPVGHPTAPVGRASATGPEAAVVGLLWPEVTP